MPMIYLSALEFIRKQPFEVLAPAYYHPHVPEDVKNPQVKPLERINRFKMVSTKRRNTTPFSQTDDPNRLQRASYSIEILLDMFQKQVEHEIVDEDDIPAIFDGLDWYLNTLRVDVETGNEVAIAYARLVIRYRAVIYKHYYRYMMTHPAALEALYPNNNKKKNLLSLMNMVGGVNTGAPELDPLRAKAKPPYDVEGSLPVEKTGSQDDMDIGSSMGLSAQALLSDNGKDFNFEDFLKGTS